MAPLQETDPGDVTWDPDRACAMPRNDPSLMVYQPTTDQVEWAVDLAVRGDLTDTRPADWNNLGLPAYSPQGQFPPGPLAGGGEVPAQIMLGILAQESNMWQASKHAADGYSGNIHQGGFYGNRDDDGNIHWRVDWDEVDCGYGVAQVTTGMHKDDTQYTEFQQKLVMVDYASNVAAGLEILKEKWNQTRQAGLIMNDGDPQYLQNWWFALWAYNTGFYPESDEVDHHGQWGVGWANNPANPIYMPNRDMFLFTDTIPEDWEGLPDNWNEESYGYGNSKHPNLWSYPERVIGFAYRPLIRYDFESGSYLESYEPADGTVSVNATPASTASAPRGQQLRPRRRLERRRLRALRRRLPPDRADAVRLHAPPLLVEPTGRPGHVPHLLRHGGPDLHRRRPRTGPADVRRLRTRLLLSVDPRPGRIHPHHRQRAARHGGPNSCAGTVSQSGTLDFRFGSAPTDPVTYPSKIDFHQIGGGYRGHFWFAHTRPESQTGMEVEATWELDEFDRIEGWAKVFVHVPSRHAHTQQAPYEVHGTTHGTRQRYLNTVMRENTWVEIGAYEFDPSQSQKVTLSNLTADGVGEDGITYDAVAFVPLDEKPRHMVVAMGDSFISGEGAGNYYSETDRDYGQRTWNACRRSRDAWPREIVPPGWNYSFGANADVNNNGLDFQFIACSGARASDFDRFPDYWDGSGDDRVTGQFGEYPQLLAGTLSPDTTLVLLSISGNDARFSHHLNNCVSVLNDSCATEAERAEMYDDVDLALGRAAEVIPEIRSRAPNAEIMLVGYPSVFSDDPYQTCYYANGRVTVTDEESIQLHEIAEYFEEGMDSVVSSSTPTSPSCRWSTRSPGTSCATARTGSTTSTAPYSPRPAPATTPT
ncbi:hypothetical protein GCM10029992_61350 [Glycomyces albus]